MVARRRCDEKNIPAFLLLLLCRPSFHDTSHFSMLWNRGRFFSPPSHLRLPRLPSSPPPLLLLLLNHECIEKRLFIYCLSNTHSCIHIRSERGHFIKKSHHRVEEDGQRGLRCRKERASQLFIVPPDSFFPLSMPLVVTVHLK